MSQERSFKKELLARWTLRDTVVAAIIAALVAGLCFILAPISFGVFQVRIAEALGLVPYDRKFGGRAAAVGALIGGIIATLMGPFGIADFLIGTVSGVICIGFAWWAGIKFKGSDGGKVLAGIVYTLVTVLFIGYFMLNLVFGLPLWESLLGIALGEAISALLLGYLLLKGIELTYKRKEVR